MPRLTTYECPRCDSLMPGECCEVHCNCAKHSHSEARAALFAAWRQVEALRVALREIDVLTDARWRFASDRALDAALEAIQKRAVTARNGE